ncbi:DUF3667 domain-containing protein [Flavobacterium sp. B17]|uniref:DUF3667 domain-containing protein n=1 Tax=Flavobacterium sp. B17 TaxID=95618 RepID=UPI0003475EF5|nr:DUF3667 domain-containing protein [Flavobacterium sp. B17]
MNCGHSVSDEFCPHCGQKTDTARITPHSLIKNDILGSIWHVEAKFFNTLKDIFFRPGKTAMDYISGKRIRYSSFTTVVADSFQFQCVRNALFRKICAT